MKTHQFRSALLASCALLLAACHEPQSPAAPTLNTPAVAAALSVPSSGVASKDAMHTVVRTPEEWRGLWAATLPNVPEASFPAAPAWFSSVSPALVVIAAQRPSGGYSLRVRNIEEAEGKLKVQLAELAPGPGCMATMVLERPALAVKLPRDLPVDLSLVAETYSCPTAR